MPDCFNVDHLADLIVNGSTDVPLFSIVSYLLSQSIIIFRTNTD